MDLEYQLTDGIGQIVMSNPPRNTLRRPAFADLATLTAFLERPALRGVILRGAGRHFSAGADLGELARLREDEETFGRELAAGKALLSAISFATVPVVAMIRGSCLGAGLEIAMACHFRVASENALLGYPEATLGLIPGLGGTVTTPEVVSRKVVIELMLTGRLLPASEGLSLGLLDEVAPTRELEGAARRLLASLVGRRSPRIVRAIMTSIHNARRLPRAEALREEGRLFLEVARATSLEEGRGGERF